MPTRNPMLLIAVCLALASPMARAQVAAAPAATVSMLDGYRILAGPQVVEGVDDDLSGITFDAERNKLLAILNKPPHVIEMERDGTVRGTIALIDFEDTEDLVSLGGGRIAVVEERRRMLTVCALPTATNVLARPGGGVLVEPGKFENVGLEGVAYDPGGDRFFVIKEKEPRRIYAVNRTAGPSDPGAVTQPWDLEVGSFGLTDVSAIAFVPATGNLLLLSDESRCIVECTTDGREVGRLALTAGSAGLTADVEQPEGLACDAEGRLYLVCEPNLFYIFAKP